MPKDMKPVVKYVIGGVVAVGVLALSLYFGNGALYKGAFTVAPIKSPIKISVPPVTTPNVELTAQSNPAYPRLGTTVICNSFKVKNNMDGAAVLRKMVFQLTTVDKKMDLAQMMLSLTDFEWVDGLPNYHLDFSAAASDSFYIVFDFDKDYNETGVWSMIVPPKSTFTESLNVTIGKDETLIGKKFRCDFKPQLSTITTAKDVPATLNSKSDLLGTVITVFDDPF